jgi:hypothetical protein
MKAIRGNEIQPFKRDPWQTAYLLFFAVFPVKDNYLI